MRNKANKVRVVYLHGLESGPNGRKASFLSARFDCHAPSLPTGKVVRGERIPEEAMEAAREAVKAHQPDVIVGSSFGGAVLAQLLAEGSWKGPAIFMASAHAKYDIQGEVDCEHAVFFHGLKDDVVEADSIKPLAEKLYGRSYLLQDDHRLSRMMSESMLSNILENEVNILAGNN